MSIMDLHSKALDLLHNAQSLLSEIDSLAPHTPSLSIGILKLKSKVKKELNFLTNLTKSTSEIKPSHIQCSNIPYFSAIVSVLKSEMSVTHIFKTFRYTSTDRVDSICVDVVANNETRWIKVRTSEQYQGLLYDSNGNEKRESQDKEKIKDEQVGRLESERYEDKEIGGREEEISGYSEDECQNYEEIIKQASKLLIASHQNPIAYIPPKIVFRWVNATLIDPQLQQKFASMGIRVAFGLLNTIETFPDVQSLEFNTEDEQLLTPCLNLDTTTLIAMVSDLIHRPFEIPLSVFDNPHLLEQRNNELLNPLLPILESIFNDRELLTTTESYNKFMEIVEFIAGPTETSRASSMFNSSPSNWKVKIIPNEPSDSFMKFIPKGKLKAHHIYIFGTGHQIHATSVSANGWMREWIRESGTGASIWIHEPRSLVEKRWLKYT